MAAGSVTRLPVARCAELIRGPEGWSRCHKVAGEHEHHVRGRWWLGTWGGHPRLRFGGGGDEGGLAGSAWACTCCGTAAIRARLKIPPATRSVTRDGAGSVRALEPGTARAWAGGRCRWVSR